MSDEKVQEKTETAAVTLEDGHAAEIPGDAAVVEAVSSAVVPGTGTTDEPVSASTDTPPASVEAAAPAVAAPSATPISDDADAFEKEMQALSGDPYDQSLRQLEADKVIVGTVMRVDREGVLVDVGAKSEGIIRLNELSRDPVANMNPESIVSVGEQIRVYVLEPEGQDGVPVLSKKRADFEQAWEKVQQSKESGETIQAMVTERVKGGLVVDLGIRGFVPASHVGNGSLKNNLDRYVGQSIPLKVIEVDKDRRKVVLSNKLAVEEEREAKSRETKEGLSPNQVRRGVVRRLTNYGAFVDLGGIDGLLHISEMSWTRINDPKEILREGQELDVLILKMDLENNRVSLGLRQILPDPWQEIVGRYKEGDVITGTITRLVPFGAFVQVEGGVEGIIPNAEMPRNRGQKGVPALASGEEVTVKVINLRPDERKMTLSLRALAPPEEVTTEQPAAPREPGETGGRENKRARGGREREGRDDYERFSPGRQEEPRFTLGEAFAAARKEKSRRDRRTKEEYDEDLGDLDDVDLTEDLSDETADA